ncbi:MAG: hypothetical protein E6H84_12705 [Chloroflexi bacterium]|nr:MAG: hypothetical protein E6H84_12705 [Chloroflexota bacterium]
MVDPRTLIAEAQALGLFQPHGAFEVHCSHCHARLDSRGDCATCGLISGIAGAREGGMARGGAPRRASAPSRPGATRAAKSGPA